MHHEVVVALGWVVNVVHFVFLIVVIQLGVGSREAGIDILRSRLVFGCTAALQVRHVRFFRWAILVKRSANKVCAVW